MIIANPLFDTAFKQLARDPEIAEITGLDVEEIEKLRA
jgi:hypothetical protein